MARKPKTQPSSDLPTPDEAAVPAQRGRTLKAAAPSPELPLAAKAGDLATDDARTAVPTAGPAKAPGRRGPGRKPKQAAGAETAPAVPDEAAELRSQAFRQPEAEATPDLIEDRTPTAAAASQADAVAGSDPAQPDLDPGRSADEPVQPLPEAGACGPAKPAAHWDRTTDRVQFDWAAIERAAARDGPNQGMARLLVAARAEGAQSRWPF
jgi:hypothetical protein